MNIHDIQSLRFIPSIHHWSQRLVRGVLVKHCSLDRKDGRSSPRIANNLLQYLWILDNLFGRRKKIAPGVGWIYISTFEGGVTCTIIPPLFKIFFLSVVEIFDKIDIRDSYSSERSITLGRIRTSPYWTIPHRITRTRTIPNLDDSPLGQRQERNCPGGE